MCPRPLHKDSSVQSHSCLTRYLEPAHEAPSYHQAPKLHDSSFSPPDPNSAGLPRHTDPTRRPEQEAGTNGKSSTTSPFVKDHSGRCGAARPWDRALVEPPPLSPNAFYFTIKLPEERMFLNGDEAKASSDAPVDRDWELQVLATAAHSPLTLCSRS